MSDDKYWDPTPLPARPTKPGAKWYAELICYAPGTAPDGTPMLAGDVLARWHFPGHMKWELLRGDEVIASGPMGARDD